MILALLLLWDGAQAGTLQVDPGPGHVVLVDGRLETYDKSGMVQVELDEGAHLVRVRPVFGRALETVVSVPAEGAVRLVRQRGRLVSAPPVQLTAGAAAPVRGVPEIPAHATAIAHGKRGFQIPVRLKDGTVIEAIFDTGATRLGLCPELARAGGFEETGTSLSHTPTGPVTVKNGQLPYIELLGRRISRVTVSVYPDAPCSVVMLGMEQLAHLEAVLRDDTLWVWIGAPAATEGSSLFRVDEHGTLSARVQLGGRQADFTVDTGASYVFLSDELARAAGARPTSTVALVEGATGVREQALLEIPVLSVGAFEARGVTAAVIEGWPDGGLLGRSALMALGAEWRFSRGRASLHP